MAKLQHSSVHDVPTSHSNFAGTFREKLADCSEFLVLMMMMTVCSLTWMKNLKMQMKTGQTVAC